MAKPLAMVCGGGCYELNLFSAEQPAEHAQIIIDDGAFISIVVIRRYWPIFTLLRGRLKKQKPSRFRSERMENLLGTLMTENLVHWWKTDKQRTNAANGQDSD